MDWFAVVRDLPGAIQLFLSHPGLLKENIRSRTRKTIQLRNCSFAKMQFVAYLTRTSLDDVDRAYRDLQRASDFGEELRRSLGFLRLHSESRRTLRGMITDGVVDKAAIADVAEVIYLTVRMVRPAIMVETGVANGLSSAYILKAMEDNNEGRLISIDTPYEKDHVYEDCMGYRLPEGKEIGWLIPNRLLHRWKLFLGRSDDVLLPLLHRLGSIDLFLHDSVHTYTNMMFEYAAAWTNLRPGGVLLSDDIGEAFIDFTAGKRLRAHYRYTVGGVARAQ